MNKISYKNKQPKSNVSIDDWYNHFKSLLDIDTQTHDDAYSIQSVTENNNINEIVNQPITENEVSSALRKLKNRKAAGPDGIVGELLKVSHEKIIDFLVLFFNTLFDRGIFPDSWCDSITMPLYKKGDINNTNNYRGISLSNISSKLFGTIIHHRLQEYVDFFNITGEQQAGLKRGYSTVDHMFTLLAFIQKQFSLFLSLCS